MSGVCKVTPEQQDQTLSKEIALTDMASQEREEQVPLLSSAHPNEAQNTDKKRSVLLTVCPYILGEQDTTRYTFSTFEFMVQGQPASAPATTSVCAQ